MSRDFSKIKKKVVVELCQSKKAFLHKILGKLWGELKYCESVGKKFVETVRIIRSNYSGNTCETFVKLLKKFYKCL